MPSPRTILITGASSGLGAALARAAEDRGDRVVATARDPQALAAGALRLRLDVTDPATIAAAVERAGDVDVLVNNAGYGLLGAFEEVTDAELRASFETNLFGALAVTRAVLPQMRARRAGHLVQMSSVIGVTSGAGGSAYSGPKFALEGIGLSLAAELRPLGIGVTIVQPGAFRTDFSGRSLRVARSHPDYAPFVAPAAEAFAAGHGTQPGDPRRAAEAVLAALDADPPPLRLPLGADAYAAIDAHLTDQRAQLERTRALGSATAF